MISLPITGNSRIPSAANSTNPTIAKAAPGYLQMITGLNAAAAVRYIKFYDKATAPVPGTDVPVMTVALPATTAFSILVGGLAFVNGISYGLTVLAADNDATAVTAADILGLNVMYS